jgi:hypothetical protein
MIETPTILALDVTLQAAERGHSGPHYAASAGVVALTDDPNPERRRAKLSLLVGRVLDTTPSNDLGEGYQLVRVRVRNHELRFVLFKGAVPEGSKQGVAILTVSEWALAGGRVAFEVMRETERVLN